jgi:heme/copper-type cytochrome/quinol oxidase subunit 2
MFKILKNIGFWFLLLFTNAVFAQCAMCKAAIESGEKNEGFNGAIIYLMLFPYIIGFGAIILIYYLRKFRKNEQDS